MRVIQHNFFFSVGNSILYLVTVSQTIILLRSTYNQHRKVQIKFGLKVYHKTKANLLFFFFESISRHDLQLLPRWQGKLEVVRLCWKSSLIVVCRVLLLFVLCFKFLWSTLFIFHKIYLKFYFYLFYLFIKKIYIWKALKRTYLMFVSRRLLRIHLKINSTCWKNIAPFVSMTGFLFADC